MDARESIIGLLESVSPSDVECRASGLHYFNKSLQDFIDNPSVANAEKVYLFFSGLWSTLVRAHSFGMCHDGGQVCCRRSSSLFPLSVEQHCVKHLVHHRCCRAYRSSRCREGAFVVAS